MSDAQVDTVTRVLREHRHTIVDPDRSTSSWIVNMCQRRGSINGGHDRHIARMILVALATTDDAGLPTSECDIPSCTQSPYAHAPHDAGVSR